jgi:hypothetical protein
MITIVSGLPRSGTSLMMGMLVAGGFPALTDEIRAPDEDNPTGYFEWEPIKQLPQHPELMRAAEGKVVKVISQLLFALPNGHEYQILFMQRPLAEVLASQGGMIRRRGSTGATLPQATMSAALQTHLNQVRSWLKDKNDLSVCYVEYHHLLFEPLRTSETIREFAKLPLDVDAMSRQVDQSLYRQRAT